MTKQPTGRTDPNAAGRPAQQPALHPASTGLPDDLDALLARDFPREAAVRKQYGMDRRTFLKVMGASMALAGFGAAGCTARSPDEEIIPYVRTPEEIIPGKPLFFASAMTMGGYATGLLIETHEGRPTRVEGNPNHPASRGGSNPYLLGSILELYNPQRSVQILHNQQPDTWEAFVVELELVLADQADANIRVLTETVTSPTLAAQIEALLERYPSAKWYQYEPVARDNVVEGAELAFGEPVNTVYQFAQADVVLALDADFLYAMPGSLSYARDFGARRKVRDASGASMNRLYAVESTPTISGAMADHRLALPPSQITRLAQALAAALGVETGAASVEGDWDQAWFDTLVSDLQAHAGACVVVPGDEQPPIVHALAHAINAALGNVGATVVYTEPVVANPANQQTQLADLVAEMSARNVDALFILGGNPVYTAPADLDFAEALAEVPLSVHLSLYDDETSNRCEWHIPQTHYVEAWSDARAFDGTLCVIQPPIGALYDTVRSAHELLAAILGDERSGYEIVRETWQEQFGGDGFDALWRKTLHDGVAAGSAAPTITPALRGDFSDALAAVEVAAGGGLELIYRPDPTLWDGRFAYNSWLQEIPHPLTKITWDNAALISPATADELELESEDLVELSLGAHTMVVPIWVLPGHADNAMTVFMGYGRGISGDIDDGRSFNAFDIRQSDAPWFASGVDVVNRNKKYNLATVRGQIDLDNLESEYNDLPVAATTLAAYQANPDIVREQRKEKTDATLLEGYDYSDGYSWGMTIDLSACIGCNACIIACQSENNIPAVGKESVADKREMHWLRVDRYYEEADDNTLTTHFQPVPCMHCETAPCELVCPVEATVHDTEGLNTMVYNRCIGTRYCSANCPYTVRRFNFDKYVPTEAIQEEYRNPDVSVRPEGVMEKCTYCTQRINAARIDAKNEGREIRDGEVVPACAAACPTQAIAFGNLNDEGAQVVALKNDPLHYALLDELGTKPRTTYLARLLNPNESLAPVEEE